MEGKAPYSEGGGLQLTTGAHGTCELEPWGPAPGARDVEWPSSAGSRLLQASLGQRQREGDRVPISGAPASWSGCFQSRNVSRGEGGLLPYFPPPVKPSCALGQITMSHLEEAGSESEFVPCPYLLGIFPICRMMMLEVPFSPKPPWGGSRLLRTSPPHYWYFGALGFSCTDIMCVTFPFLSPGLSGGWGMGVLRESHIVTLGTSTHCLELMRF